MVLYVKIGRDDRKHPGGITFKVQKHMTHTISILKKKTVEMKDDFIPGDCLHN